MGLIYRPIFLMQVGSPLGCGVQSQSGPKPGLEFRCGRNG